MRDRSCDILIVGGGVGGCAAAMAACSLGYKVVMTEPTDWIGGQLTSQAVPPDEHPWIEQFGCTRRYRRYRDRVRRYYRDNFPLTTEAHNDRLLNPGGGWVSWLCHEPRIGWQVLNSMLQPFISAGLLDIVLQAEPISATSFGDTVQGVTFTCQGEKFSVNADYILDASELGDLLPLAKVEHVVGAESRSETGESHAVDGPAEPDNQQGFTWVFALGLNDEDNTIPKPADYDRWKSYKPAFWPGPLLGWDVTHAHTGQKATLPLFNSENPDYELFTYRQVIDPSVTESDTDPVTLVNWPQNDYFVKPLIGSEEDRQIALKESKDLGLSLLYWMQTEAPRHDGGTGFPELYLRPDVMGTDDGFAKAPYIRESRRIKAAFTILEQHVSTADNPGRDRAQEFRDAVGIGAYRIDLHPSTSGAGIIDFSSLPFQIPLGALVPVRVRNLLPACKNIGTTHITNGCYRLHPVEWNIGEAAGLLAGFCLAKQAEPAYVSGNKDLLVEFQMLLIDQGIELEWPELRPL